MQELVYQIYLTNQLSIYLNDNMVKFIWDFRGMDALKTAEHQLVHLNQFMNKNGLNIESQGCETVNEMHSFCFVVMDKEHISLIREKLKPHRGLAVSSTN